MFAGVIGLLSLIIATITGIFTVELAAEHWYTIVLVLAEVLAIYVVMCHCIAKVLRKRTVATAGLVDLNALRSAQDARTNAWRAQQAEIAAERAAARSAARLTANNARFADLEEDE